MRTGQGVTGGRQKRWNFIASVFSLIRIAIKPKIQNDRPEMEAEEVEVGACAFLRGEWGLGVASRARQQDW